MFGAIRSILGATSAVIESTGNVVITTANAINNVSRTHATTGIGQLADSVNYGLMSLAETSASIAFETALQNDKTFAESKIEGYSSMREYLNSRMS